MACGPTRRLERSDTWPQQPALHRSKIPCQRRAVHTGFSKETFAGTRGNDGVAPKTAVRGDGPAEFGGPARSCVSGLALTPGRQGRRLRAIGGLDP